MARAQGPAPTVGEPDVPEKIGKDFRALRVTTAPRVDGVLDDEAWQRAQAIDDFVQNEPANMAPPLDRTVVQVAYDDRSVYVAVQCFTQDPSSVATGLGRRHDLPPRDLVRLTFDPRHDHQVVMVKLSYWLGL